MVDGCFVINLSRRADRWGLFQSQIPLLARAGLVPERFEAVDGRALQGFGVGPWFTRRLSGRRTNGWAGKAGCTLSHRNAIATAKKRGWKNVLILEDDVSFDSIALEQWNNLEDAIAGLPNDWVAVYLYGHHPVSPVKIVHSYSELTCYEICGAFSTVAYVLNGKYFDALLRSMPTEETIWPWTARYKTVDRWFSRQFCLLGSVYAVSPFGIVHLKTQSDATTGGAAYSAPSFNFDCLTSQKWFFVLRDLRCSWNSLSLVLSYVRYVIKQSRGL